MMFQVEIGNYDSFYEMGRRFSVEEVGEEITTFFNSKFKFTKI